MSPLTLSLMAAAVLAMGPFEKNDPLIEQGTALYEQGQFEQALAKFEEAAAQHPQDPRVPYNRGLALHKAGRNEEAKQAFTRAIELDRAGDGALTGKAHYNLGNVAASTEDQKTAVREYREALKRDPGDQLARHNLEVVLKNLPPPQAGPDGGTPDGGSADAGRPDAGPDAGRPDGGADAGAGDGGSDAGAPDGGGDGGADGGGSGDGGAADGGKGDGGNGEQPKRGDGGQAEDGQRGDAGADGGDGEPRDGGAPEESQRGRLPDGGVDASRLEAEQLLDSMKRTEKTLQSWRFRQKGQKVDPRGKDW